jgi:hypothetical protein
MKIRPFQRYANEDYKSAPKWFWDFLSNLNMMVDTLNSCLQNNLDIDNNLLAERQTVTVSHNTPATVSMKKIGTPRLVRLGYANGYQGTASITGYGTDGSVIVTVFFVGTPPTTAQAVTLVFEP